MTDASTNLARSALADVLHPGRTGRAGTLAGVTAFERTGVAIASLAARKAQATALAAKIKARTGLDLPTTPRLASAGHLGFLWTGPNQWMAHADGEDGAAFAADLARDVAGLGSVTNQSDGRTLIRISGARARDTLAKGCMIDFHPSVFKVADTAVAPIALLSAQVTRLPDEAGNPVFELAVMRSFAASLWHWLEASAAEYGLEVA